MPLWGTRSGSSTDEKKPTWQRDRDIHSRKNRPAINEERNTYAANTGWVRRVVKSGRIIEEILVATSGSTNLAEVFGGANVTSVHFTTSNTQGRQLTGSPITAEVSLNEKVYVTGAPVLTITKSDGTTDLLTSASSASRANGTSVITFTEDSADVGEWKLTGPITAAGSIFDAERYDLNKTIVEVNPSAVVLSGLDNASTPGTAAAGKRRISVGANTIVSA